MLRFHATTIALLGLSIQYSEARQWTDLIDKSIYLQPQLDTSRYQLKIELDPFFDTEGEDYGASVPTAQPVTSNWIGKSESPTMSPSVMPSDAPSSTPTAPTAAPTTREENIDGNGGCQEGTVLYRVNMYDAWGDGWDSTTKVSITGVLDQDSTQISGNTVTRTHTTRTGDTTVSISTTIELTSEHPFGTASAGTASVVNPLGLIFEGTLHQGSHADAYVCLMPRRCYEVVAFGGDYLDEVGWDIQQILLGSNETEPVIVEGGAPNQCSFSIPDENGEIFCEASCSSTLSPKNTQAPVVKDHLFTIGEEEEEDTSSVILTSRNFDSRTGWLNGNKFLANLRNGES